ncbi:hypothetical protein CRG98_040504 [Punica granatum]|uniref:Uncharacterized protein n=1 Tax=Punica granatum TaxID=22663 RepID=A0A2I0I5X7_PUNGR|nr:hypothetical protein CRG98_040504 [Punica granatum]
MTGRHLGSKSILPYLSPELTGQKLLVGANFASAGIGILNDTGLQFVNIIRMFQQLDYFQEHQQRVSEIIGQYSLSDYVWLLISEYKKLLMRLYDLGARRVLVTGTGPLGCAPVEIGLRSPDGHCAPELSCSTLQSPARPDDERA